MIIRKISFLSIIICMSMGFQLSFQPTTANAFSPQVIQQGAVGEDVIELQSRLGYIGFYNDDIDGVFGWTTYWALRNFQYEFGMEVDGVAGQTTKEKLEETTEYEPSEQKNQQGTPEQGEAEGTQNENQETESKEEGEGEEEAPEPTGKNVPKGYSENDIRLLANAVNGEARGEPHEGKVAVAAVILNRVESETFPNTASGVIFEPRAFTAVSDGQIWLEPDESATEAVMDAINGWDPSGNALYYFNPETATSDWIWSREQIKKIGKHIFAE